MPTRSGTAPWAEQLFWKMLEHHLQARHPGFVHGGPPKPCLRFRRSINIVAATTIQLVVNCITWAKHRRSKAAVKSHLRLA